jgi:hypothetical protein
MITHQLIFQILLVASCGYALWQGGKEERVVAFVSVVATIGSRFATSPLNVRYRGVETGLVAVDVLVLAAFVVIALRSPRFWPLWVAGLQLTSSTAHLMKALDESLLPVAYGAAIALWSYPILMILAAATWRHQRTRRRSYAGPVGQ